MGLEEKYTMHSDGIEFLSDIDAEKAVADSPKILAENKKKLQRLRNINEKFL